MASKQSKPVLRAVLKFPDGSKVETLLIHNDKGFRWSQAPGLSIWPTDHVSQEIAVKYLRVAVDSDPSMVGHDLTFYPISPPTVERAAEAAVRALAIAEGRAIVPHPQVLPMVQEAIEQETDITEILEHLQTLLAYLFRIRVPWVDPATRRMGMIPLLQGDLTLRGLMLPLVESCEKALKHEMPDLKKLLMAPVDRIVVAQPGPQKGNPS